MEEPLSGILKSITIPFRRTVCGGDERYVKTFPTNGTFCICQIFPTNGHFLEVKIFPTSGPTNGAAPRHFFLSTNFRRAVPNIRRMVKKDDSCKMREIALNYIFRGDPYISAATPPYPSILPGALDAAKPGRQGQATVGRTVRRPKGTVYRPKSTTRQCPQDFNNFYERRGQPITVRQFGLTQMNGYVLIGSVYTYWILLIFRMGGIKRVKSWHGF